MKLMQVEPCWMDQLLLMYVVHINLELSSLDNSDTWANWLKKETQKMGNIARLSSFEVGSENNEHLKLLQILKSGCSHWDNALVGVYIDNMAAL